MASGLGKRKRKAAEAPSGAQEIVSTSTSEEVSHEDAQAVFKRYFEARFKPLAEGKKVVKATTEVVEAVEEDDDDDESDWEGISDGEEVETIQVVEHTDIKSGQVMAKQELKSFMSSKPPKSDSVPLIKTKSAPPPDEDDASEAANLKNDLALQRLLAESHLLESASNPTLSGTNRHKATDLRLQALGSKKSILAQEKMPMSHRKGIVAKKTEREETRRREARENGIVLEKSAKKKAKPEGRRERSIGGPAVGRFTGGTLILSKKDIREIEGPRRGTGLKNPRRGGRRGR